jgi:hypothetical protein
LPALASFTTLSNKPSSVDDIRIFEERDAGEDVKKLFPIEEGTNLRSWDKWKTLFLRWVQASLTC